MSNQWKNQDNASNSVIWATNQYNLGITTANQSMLYDNTTPSGIISGKTVGIFATDSNEMAAIAVGGTEHPAHTGWSVRTVGTGGRAGRVHHETLVALSSIIGVSNNQIIPGAKIVILSQPANSNVNVNAAITFTVSTQILGGQPIQSGVALPLVPGAPNITVTYLWQIDQGNGAWINVAQTGVFTGNTTPTLSISNNATLNGNTLRVIISGSNGALTVTSANATLKTY